ncbi:MAG TPA: diacylglycerol kinase family protein, partial [Anaerolineae bacterium]|nr:diacylglycerol kinase family protein [Anaerolineae bacterium]
LSLCRHRTMNRLLRSFSYAISGLGYAFRSQANLRIHTAISIAVIVVGLWLQLSPIEWAILIVTMMIVLAVELINTAIEATLDRVSIEEHPLVKVGKDTAAGAVFISALGAVMVGLLILGPRLLAVLGQR